MQNHNGEFFVAVTASAAYVKVEGLATMNNCAPLQQFLEEHDSCGSYVFDFERCRGFDSTFMGTLIGTVRREAGAPSPTVILLNLSDDHRNLLSSVGVDRVVDICSGSHPLPVDLKRLEDRRPGKPGADLKRVVKAHENLLRLDPENEEKFGAFLEMVKGELGRTT